MTSPVDLTQLQMQALGPNNQYSNADFSLTSGTVRDGVWTATVQLPETAASGTWTVGSIGLHDTLGRFIPLINPSITGGDWVVG